MARQNQLTALPPEITQLTGLQELWLDSNQLTALPPEITQLTGLNDLTLVGNQLTALPPEITQLTSLQELWLDNNQLTALPPEITQLTGLNDLRLSGNQLTALPPEIGQLTSLQQLWLDNNQLTALPPEITQLISLNDLRLSGNQLTALPPEIGQLTGLRQLWLSDNQLTALPPEIGQLTGLQQLSLSDNQLTALPRQLADLLDDGLSIELDNNPFPDPLPELIHQGADAVAVYLRSLEDAVAQYEAKVLLVGEGNVGKTSLSAALRGDAFIDRRPFTHGIEIWPLVLRHPGADADMTVRLWDFGGQEVYRVTHQFFFSPRGLYLMVWNPREGQEQNEVEGWLRRIRLRAGRDARALIVATHCADDRHPDLDYPRLQQVFPRLLAGHFEVDNQTGHGMPVTAGGDRRAGSTTAADGTAHQSALGRRPPGDIRPGPGRAADLLRGNSLRSASGTGSLASEIGTLAALMHDLGQIIYYGEDEGLRDFVVLNPEWLTKAISYVLRDDPTRHAAGELDHARLKEIWQDRAGRHRLPGPVSPVLPPADGEVRYLLPAGREHRSLVAQLVPYERPALPWDSGSPSRPGSAAWL